MSLRQLSSHGQRMTQDLNELTRRLDEKTAEHEMRTIRTQPEVMDEVIKAQRTIHEQQRLKDELRMDIKIEDERQFWVEREQRQRIQRKVYGDRFPCGPEGKKDLGYDSTPPELLRLGRVHDDHARHPTEVSTAGARQHNAMAYVPPHEPPKSAYQADLPPTQMFRQNLLVEARAKGWPQAPQREGRGFAESEEPGRQRRGGGRASRRGSSGPAPEKEGTERRDNRESIHAADLDEPHPDAPQSEGGFFAGFSGWTEASEGHGHDCRCLSPSPSFGKSGSEHEHDADLTPRSASHVAALRRSKPKARTRKVPEEAAKESGKGFFAGLASMVGLGGEAPDSSNSDETSTVATAGDVCTEEPPMPFCAFAGFGEAPTQHVPASASTATASAGNLLQQHSQGPLPQRGASALLPQFGAASAAYSSLRARQEQLSRQWEQVQQRQQGQSPQHQQQVLQQQHGRQLHFSQPPEELQYSEGRHELEEEHGMPPFAAFAGEGDAEAGGKMRSRKLRAAPRAVGGSSTGPRGTLASAGDAESSAGEPMGPTRSRKLRAAPRAGDAAATGPRGTLVLPDAPAVKRSSQLGTEGSGHGGASAHGPQDEKPSDKPVRAAGFEFEEEFHEQEEDDSWGIAAAFGLEESYAAFTETVEEAAGVKETPWEVEQRLTGVNPTARYMAGCCRDRAPPLEAPDLEEIVGEGYHGVVVACEKVLMARQAGRLGAKESAQAVLNYVASVAKNADALITHSEGSKHVSIVVDVLNFYPLSVQIHIWALEALIAVYRAEDHDEQESLSGPIFDAVTTLMHTYEKDKGLSRSTPEMTRKILNALALVVTPATTQRLVSAHVDFALRIIRQAGVGPSLMEHGLQLLLAARIAHRMRDQAMSARAALRSFRAEPRLVTRALLALAAAFEVAAEAAEAVPDEGLQGEEEDESGAFGLEGLFGEEEDEEADSRLQIPHTLEASEKPATQGSAARRRKQRQRLIDQSRDVHKDLLEKATALAAADKGLLVDGVSAEDDSGRDLVPVGLRDIITGMDLYAQDRKVQGAGAVALAAAVKMPGISLRSAKAEGAIRALMLAQKNFPSSRAIALHTCLVMVQFARRENKLMNIETACTALNAGTSFARDAEVVVAALQVIHAFALRLRELCPDRGSRLRQMSGDLVRIGEGRHANPHALAMLLVIFVAAASNGNGTSPGGMPGEQWRNALAGAAAIVVPLRVLYEHIDNLDLVLTASIALRLLTFGNAASATHVARLKGVEALLGAIQKHCHRTETARELLAALANVGQNADARSTFKSKLPDSAEAIYNAMEKTAAKDPDVLTQGCRALGALTAGPKQDQVRHAIDQYRIDKAIMKASSGIAAHAGEADDEGLLGMITGSAEAAAERRRKLHDLCDQLINGHVAAAPQFGRLISKDGILSAKVAPRKRAGQTGAQERLET